MTIAILLAVSGGLAFAGTAGAHEETSSPCDEGDTIKIVVDDRGDDVDQVSGGFTCGGATAACNMQSDFCSDDSPDKAASDSTGGCSGTSSDGNPEHVHCSIHFSSNDGDDDGGGVNLPPGADVPSSTGHPPTLQEILAMPLYIGMQDTPVGMVGVKCQDGHCHAVTPTCVPALLPLPGSGSTCTVEV